GDPAGIDELWERGVRLAGLTWNNPNEFAGGLETQEQGLTAAGRTLLARFSELGIVADLAHASDATWRDVLQTDARVVVTHAACRAVDDHPRNLSAEQLAAIAARGGLLGMMS